MPKGTKVLMVDDDKMLLDMYAERLGLAGYNVIGVTNGEECLAKIQQVKPDIVLLDIMMPKVNGYDTLSSIKSDPATKDIPVIILSALVRDINKSRAIEAGADDYIIKSEVMPADVIKKIESVLEKYHKVPPSEKVETAPPSVPPPPVSQPPVAPPPIVPSGPPPAVPPKVSPQQTSAPPPEIQFEPHLSPLASHAPPPKIQKKSSPLTILFLILIVFLIILSDIFFYLKVFKGGSSGI